MQLIIQYIESLRGVNVQVSLQKLRKHLRGRVITEYNTHVWYRRVRLLLKLKYIA